MEEDWAVDLAVSKLEVEGEVEGREGGGRRVEEGRGSRRGNFGWRRVRGLNKRHVKKNQSKNGKKRQKKPGSVKMNKRKSDKTQIIRRACLAGGCNRLL